MWVKRFYLALVKCGNSLQSPFLLFIRLFWGGTFFLTGCGKFAHIDQVMSFFQSLSVPFPMLSAYASASVECFGGALLFLGLASRLVALPLMFTMIVAFLTAYPNAVRNIFSDPQSFINKDPFSFLFVALIVFIFGPGKYSVDYWLEKKQQGSE